MNERTPLPHDFFERVGTPKQYDVKMRHEFVLLCIYDGAVERVLQDGKTSERNLEILGRYVFTEATLNDLAHSYYGFDTRARAGQIIWNTIRTLRRSLSPEAQDLFVKRWYQPEWRRPDESQISDLLVVMNRMREKQKIHTF